MLKEIGEVMKEAYDRNWITTRDGNCAVRFRDKIFMTPSGVKKNNIMSDHLISLTLKSPGVLFNLHDGLSPTGEWEMHYRILESSEEELSTLHLHPPHIVAAMHAGWELMDLVSPFPEVYRYTKVGKNVDSYPALSKELALETFENISKEDTLHFDLVGQKSHGVCAVGKNPWHAFEHIERVEHIAKVVLLSGVNPPLKPENKKSKKIFSFLA